MKTRGEKQEKGMLIQPLNLNAKKLKVLIDGP